MSQYTIINFIPEVSSGEKWKDLFNLKSQSRFVRTRKRDDSIILVRFGGYKKDEVCNRMISQEDGFLLYDIYSVGSFETDQFIGHFIICEFEDTGGKFESDLYKIYAYGEAEKIDSVTRYGQDKITDYYKDTFDLSTAIHPP